MSPYLAFSSFIIVGRNILSWEEVHVTLLKKWMSKLENRQRQETARWNSLFYPLVLRASILIPWQFNLTFISINLKTGYEWGSFLILNFIEIPKTWWSLGSILPCSNVKCKYRLLHSVRASIFLFITMLDQIHLLQ